jgi:endonuclease/exonuclease/phosphatase (EEP) superfamily protein YafD
MAGGIPVNGAIVTTGGHRLLVVVVDLQCCGGAEDDWQEDRRQVEAREIRKLINQVLALRKVDATIIAGDLNTVGTRVPVELLLGLNKDQRPGLSEAEILHFGGQANWTWDGRGTPFPSSILDYQLYDASGLQIQEAYVFDTEDLDPQALETLGLQAGDSNQLSRHRPLVVEYSLR